MSDFQDQFVASKGQPIQYEGREVHLAVRLPVTTGDEFRIRLVHASPDPIQGLKIRAERAQIATVRDAGAQFVIWNDTAPAETTIRVNTALPGATLILRNVWKHGAEGAMMQGLRYAGMMQELDATGALVLQCSDGRGAPDFHDLIAVVSRAAR
jgi:hypothetical protein